MSATIVPQVQRGLRQALPLATALLAMLLDLVPLATLAPDAVGPSFTLVVVYYWTLHRPDLVTALDLFLLGLLIDVVAATPWGSTSLTLLVVRRMVLAPQRPMLARFFLAAWLGFAATLAVAQSIRWLVMALFHGSLFPVGPLAVEALLTAAIYPPVALMLGLVGLLLERPDDAPQG